MSRNPVVELRGMRTAFAPLALVLLLTGCAEPPSEPPTPHPTSRPPIDRPLDVSAYATTDTVCEIVPPTALEELGLSVFSACAAIEDNPACRLRGAGMVNVQVFGSTDRLARAYTLDRPGGEHLPYFVRAFSIGGQPAAHVQTKETDLDQWCVTVVAMTDASSVEVENHGVDACATADRLAAAIVGKLAS
jgi:hypothetical protein